MQLHLVRKNWSVSSSACIISDYSNKSVFLVLTLTVEYKMFWLGRRAPNISFRFLEHATSVYGMFNRDSGKGTPWYVYISNIFITSWWWWWFRWIWGYYHHISIVMAQVWLILSVPGPVLLDHPGVYAPSSDKDWMMRSKAESLWSVSNYFNSSAPFSSLWLHCQNKGSCSS